MTNLVYHGAEHTRFGHSIGVMHLVTKAFRTIIRKGVLSWSEKKIAWYEQILRLVALTHDLGHAPFSHASEAVFPDKLEHEDFTEKIIKETCVAEYINDIGKECKNTTGYNITPDLICDIYTGKIAGENSEFVFLRSFMDSELDCDKMDYLFRDSLYCGVNYPGSVEEYIEWDDIRVIQLMKEKAGTIESCNKIVNRIVYPCIVESKEALEFYEKIK